MNKEELLYKYFLDDLSSEEQLVFTKLLEDDSEFKAQFEFEKSVQRVIKAKNRSILEEKVSNLETDIHTSSEPKTIPWKILRIAASIVLLISLGIYMYTSYWSNSPEQLFASYYEKYPNTVFPINRSNNQEETPELLAFEAYESDNHNKTVELLEELSSQQDHAYIHFYLGHAYLENNQANKAIQEFKNVITKGQDFLNESRWYLALAFLKNDELSKAREILKIISREGKFKANEAKKLLELTD